MNDAPSPGTLVGRLLGKRWFQGLLLLGLVVGATGIWALLHPGGIWLQHWRATPSAVSSRFIFGPYPLEDDFVVLHKQGVTTIISLLDPDLPYEQVLLGQERELAKRHGIEVLNFPMASILGQSFGKDYVKNSRAAAQAAIDSKGVAYIHCYLGLHRAKRVQDYLQSYATTSTYRGKLQSGRSADTLVLDYANIAFMEGRSEDVLSSLAKLQEKTDPASLLEGWANYRLGRIPAARAAFGKVAAKRPDHADAVAGLGYCALRDGDLVAASAYFERVLAAHPDDPSAMQGLGHVRHRQGRGAEAKALFEAVLSKHPGNSEVREILKTF